jgi:hypothetical protein
MLLPLQVPAAPHQHCWDIWLSCFCGAVCHMSFLTSLLYEMCRTVQYGGSSVVNDSTTLYDPIRPRTVVLSNTIRLYCHCSSEYPAWCLLTPSVEYGYTIMSRMACQDLVGWLPACICHRCFFSIYLIWGFFSPLMVCACYKVGRCAQFQAGGWSCI